MLLMDQLQVPRLADAEAIHGADFHVGDHLRRRHHDGFDILVGIDAAGGEPVADPEIVGAAREGHRGLDRLAGGFLLLEHRLERRGVGADLEVGIFLGDRDALGVEIEPRQDVHRRRTDCSASPCRPRSDTASASGYARHRCRCLPSPARGCRAWCPTTPAWRLRRQACRIWRRTPCPWRRTAARRRSTR